MANGFLSKQSHLSVNDAVVKLQGLLESRGIRLHAVIDHSGDALKAGIEMPPTKLLIFGNATAGTPAMLVAPTLAIDLPLKILIWQDEDEKKTWISYNSPFYLQERHHIPADLVKNLAIVETLSDELA